MVEKNYTIDLSRLFEIAQQPVLEVTIAFLRQGSGRIGARREKRNDFNPASLFESSQRSGDFCAGTPEFEKVISLQEVTGISEEVQFAGE
jgi:hypothetical protein